MAIKHKIRESSGKLIEVELTPRKAIKYFCAECVVWVRQEIEKCTVETCPLWPFRLGDSHSVSDETKKARSDRMIERLKKRTHN
jgi:hypothetical protein